MGGGLGWGAWGMYGERTPLPTHPVVRNNPESLVFFPYCFFISFLLFLLSLLPRFFLSYTVESHSNGPAANKILPVMDANL